MGEGDPFYLEPQYSKKIRLCYFFHYSSSGHPPHSCAGMIITTGEVSAKSKVEGIAKARKRALNTIFFRNLKN